MLKGKKFIITGGSGFLGSHLIDLLENVELVPKENIFVPRSKHYDLTKRESVNQIFYSFPADIVIHLATTVGSLPHNKVHPADLLQDNLLMGLNMLNYSMLNKVEKFVSVGSALCYPESAPVPLKEEDIWTGLPEESSAPYGLFNRIMIAQSKNLRIQYGLNAIHIIPANLYGPRDNFDAKRIHVIPSLIKRFDEAIKVKKEVVEAWGTGNASREFLYVEDAARGIILALKNYDKPEPLNLGSGIEIKMSELYTLIAINLGYEGKIIWDSTKPEGPLRRCLDNERIVKELGFKAKFDFSEGLKKTIDWFKENKGEIQF